MRTSAPVFVGSNKNQSITSAVSLACQNNEFPLPTKIIIILMQMRLVFSCHLSSPVTATFSNSLCPTSCGSGFNTPRSKIFCFAGGLRRKCTGCYAEVITRIRLPPVRENIRWHHLATMTCGPWHIKALRAFVQLVNKTHNGERA